MHVGVHLFIGQLDKQQHHRENRGRKNVAVALGQRVLHQPVADQAAIHKHEDGIAVQLLQLRLGNKAMQPQITRDRRLVVLAAAPRWRLWNSHALQLQRGGQGHKLIQGFPPKYLVDAV